MYENQLFPSDHRVYSSISSVNLDSFIEYSCIHDAQSTKQNKAAAATACKQMYKQNGAEKRMWSKVEFSHKYLLTWAFFWKKKNYSFDYHN